MKILIKYGYLITLYCCFFSIFLYGIKDVSSQEIIQNQIFQFTADINQFRYSGDTTLVEVTSSIPRSLLEYIPDEDQFIAELIVTVELFRADTLVQNNIWKHRDYIKTEDEKYKDISIHLIDRIIALSGDYTFLLRMQDYYSKKVKEYEIPLPVKNFGVDSLITSDILITYEIKQDQSDDICTKNGYRIAPYADGLFGVELPVLYSYMEIYNLCDPSGSDDSYQVICSILDQNGNEVKKMPAKEHKKVGTSMVNINQFPAVTLRTGKYNYQIEVIDIATGQSTKSIKSFFVYRAEDIVKKEEPTKPIVEINEDSLSEVQYLSVIMQMTEDAIDKEYEYCEYIHDKKMKKIYKTLDLEAKRKYIMQFWLESGRKDPKYSRFEYLKRIDYANRYFRGINMEGWKTERGRVYLVYGEPDQIDRNLHSPTGHEIEIWNYFAIENGVLFIFTDLYGYGDLRLVHSTARGEIRDPRWEDR